MGDPLPLTFPFVTPAPLVSVKWDKNIKKCNTFQGTLSLISFPTKTIQTDTQMPKYTGL